jgi:hypothetical protein
LLPVTGRMPNWPMMSEAKLASGANERSGLKAKPLLR